MANYLRSLGVKKGDAVSIYMPMVCELPIAMLACARIGAVHSVVFGGFSAEALAGEVEGGCRAQGAGQMGGIRAWAMPSPPPAQPATPPLLAHPPPARLQLKAASPTARPRC